MIVCVEVEGKVVKEFIRHLSTGKFGEAATTKREYELKQFGLEAQIEAHTLIYNKEWEVYAVIRSRADPNKIPHREYQDFQLQVAKAKAMKKN